MSTFDKKLMEKLELSEKEYKKLKSVFEKRNWGDGKSMGSHFQAALKEVGLDWKKLKSPVKSQLKRLQEISTKTASENKLRSKVIRLAHDRPELREHLLPLLENQNDLKTKVAGVGLKSSVNNAAHKEVVSWVKDFVRLLNKIKASDLGLETREFGSPPAFSIEKVYTLRRGMTTKVLVEFYVRGYRNCHIKYTVGSDKVWIEFESSGNVGIDADKSPSEAFQSFLVEFKRVVASIK